MKTSLIKVIGGYTPKLTYVTALTFLPLCVNAQHETEQHQLEEVFITGEMAKSGTETALPINSLGGEELRKAAAPSLGETLKNQLGVNSASFGTGVGLPVIRGQSGSRVSVIQNGLNAMDAASANPDHANSVDPLVAERIEIIRGPATLLYGNGAIGGVVNVIDNRIPETLPKNLTGALELRHNTVSSEDSGAFKVENGINSFAWHLDGAYRDSNNTRIPGFAINEEALEEDDHEGEEEHHQELDNSYGFIDNSDSRSHSFAAGGSWIGERAFAGLAVSRLSNQYGLPPGSHIDEEEHAGHEEEVEEEHGADIRIDLQQTRYEFKAGLDTQGFFTRLNTRIAYNDYEHIEFAREDEPEEEHEEGHLEEQDHSTHFTNRGLEARLSAQYARNDNWNGVVGMQLGDSKFAVEGEEGFIPRTDINSVGIFALESIRSGRWIYELGARLQQVELSPEDGCNREDTSWSASAAAIWQLSSSVNTSVSVSRAQRSAGVEERYSNVDTASCALAAPTDWKIHNPTGLVELGNPGLQEETSNNLELSLHKHLGNIHGELNVYFNQADDYIYLAPIEEQGQGIPVASYQQRDAEFYGYEAEVTLPVAITSSKQLELTLFSDAVRGKLATGENLPRIPPARSGFNIELLETQWSINLRASYIAEAQRLAPSETPTTSYTMVDLSADYHFDWGNQEVLLFAEGFNLLDETVRNHTSFAKELAPEPGRGLRAGVRLSF